MMKLIPQVVLKVEEFGFYERLVTDAQCFFPRAEVAIGNVQISKCGCVPGEVLSKNQPG